MTEAVAVDGKVRLAGQRVVLTGAGRGLGVEIATAFATAGARVALVARTVEQLTETKNALPGSGHMALPGDVRSPEFNEFVADQVCTEWGGLDVWIANAGISPVVASPQKTSPGVWREVIDVNLSGAFFGARAAARVMRPGGRIIATSSVLGQRSMRGLAAYSASKAGLEGLVRSLAVDLGPRGITVNAVVPGWFESPLASPWMADGDKYRQIAEHTGLRRWGKTGDLAGAYLFLASPAAGYVTGSVLPVDGGYLVV